jgi:hypothetical protein
MSCTVDDLSKELSGLTDRLTTQVRTLSLGLLAFTAGILSGVLGFGGKDPRPVLPRWAEINLLLVAAFLFLVLLCDLLQCVLSIRATRTTIATAEDKIERKEIAEDATVLFNYALWDYRWATTLFWGKIWLLSLTTVWFAVVTFAYCVRHFQ